MAASMIRAYTQSSLSRQLSDIIWREHNIKYILQTLTISYVKYQYYHVSSLSFNKHSRRTRKKSRLLFSEEDIFDPALSKPVKKSLPLITVWNEINVQELADSSNRDVNDVLDLLSIIDKENKYNKNSILTPNSFISNIVKRLGGKAKFISKQTNNLEVKYEDIIKRPPPDESQLIKRHPVVTIMGHVDHGKTTLLDALRNTSVVESEFGGITQHIGAFNVTLKSGDRVTFLDTPGHAAFTSMRHRGAHVTDIVVLVVAADDGIKDQTVQSIEMARDANVPIIVALNKIDKPNIDINKTQNELAKYDIIVEELGGEVQCVKISALNRINLQELTEAIILQAELMNLKGDPVGLVEAVIIECSYYFGRGKLVTALIQRGTLKKGCILVSGVASAKVRAMFNDSGHPVFEAKPSEAVQIVGWKALPNVGDEILEVENDKILQATLKFREKQHKETLAREHKTVADKKLEEHLLEYKQILGIRRLYGKDKQIMKIAKEKLAKRREESESKIKTSAPVVSILIKGDVAGSVEALLDIFETYTYDAICHLSIIHYGVGPIIQTDVDLAETFGAIIYGFNVNTTNDIKQEANKKGVCLRFYNIVYKLIDNIKEEINSILPEIDVEEIIGEAQVLKKFDIKDKKEKISVAGCRCIKGVLLKSEMYHVIRGKENIYTGKLESMKHLKEEKSSIEADLECGLRFEDPMIPFQPGDTIICFRIIKQKQKIDWDPGF